MTLHSITNQVSRILPDIFLSTALLFFYLSGTYLDFTPTIQTIALKATLVSLGFIHAHIINTLAFPVIDWANADMDKTDKLRAPCLYLVIIYAYCIGG